MRIITFIFLFFTSLNINAYFSPIGFSFTHEGDYLQFPKRKHDVYGFRTNLLGMENKRVVGLDVGVWNITDELFGGTQIGVVNVNRKDSYILGMQFGFILNRNDGQTRALGYQVAGIANYNPGGAQILGLQAALVNVGKNNVYGFQLGLYNRAETIIGLQLGVVNYCENLHGIQVGLINSCKSCLISLMPGINIGI